MQICQYTILQLSKYMLRQELDAETARWLLSRLVLTDGTSFARKAHESPSCYIVSVEA